MAINVKLFASTLKMHEKLVFEAIQFRLELVGYGDDRLERVYRCIQCGEEYNFKTSKVRNRSGRSCFTCKFEEQSDLQPNFRDELPELAAMWDTEKNGNSKPEFFPPASHHTAWFKCPEGHSFQYKLNSFFNRKNKKTKGWDKCPRCNIQDRDTYAQKGVWEKSTSFADKYPHLLKEWDYDKNTISPNEISYGSKIKIHFKCEYGHEFVQTANSRSQSNCPHCNNRSTSKIEIRIFTELKSIYSDTLWRKKLNDNELDIFIPELSLAVEYDGKYWHQDKANRDIKKQKI